MTEFDITRNLREALVSLGVPEDFMFTEMEVCTGAQRPYRADFLVVASDKKTPLFLFEIKTNKTFALSYQNARRQMAGAIGQFSCFVVTSQGRNVYVAPIVKYEINDSEWVCLQNNAGLKRIIGDYSTLSQKVILRFAPETAEVRALQLVQFRIGLIAYGIPIFIIASFLEAAIGKEVSYQLAGLFGLVFILYAASYGIIKELKWGDGKGVSFYGAGDKNDDKQKGRRD